MELEVKIRGVLFDVEFEYDPGEKTVMWDNDGGGNPGQDPSVTILSVKHLDTDFTEFFSGEEEIVEKAVLETMGV